MDDLLDLEWDKKSTPGANAAPLQPQPQQYSKQESGNVQVTGARGASSLSSYNFDALTRAMPSTSSSSSSWHQGKPRPQASQPMSNTQHTGSQGKQWQGQGQGQGRAGSDVFSALWTGSDTNSMAQTTRRSNMTLAERLKSEHSAGSSLQASRSSSPLPPASIATSTSTSSSAWDGLDDFMTIGSTVSSKSNRLDGKFTESKQGTRADTNAPGTDLWGFDEPKASPSAEALNAKIQPQANYAGRAPPNRKAAAPDPFDFSDFEDPGSLQSSALDVGVHYRDRGADNAKTGQRGQKTIGSTFDIFDEANGTIGQSGSKIEDDELEIKSADSEGRPRQSLASRQVRPSDSRLQVQKDTHSPRTGASPPPHIVGKLVEMGFGPLEARNALAETAGGQDVAAALERLVRQSDAGTREQIRSSRSPSEAQDRELARRLQREEERSYKRPTQQSYSTRAGETGDDRSSTPEWQKQADELYGKASEFGTSVFKSANALWAQAKSQAQKALDERSNASGPSSGRASPATTADRPQSSRRWAVPSRERKEWHGKPKWMMDAELDTESSVSQGPAERVESIHSRKDDEKVPKRATTHRDEVMQEESTVSSREVPPMADLWDSQDSKADNIAASSGPTRATQTAAAKSNNPLTKADRRKRRQLVDDDPGSLATSSSQKARGNESFKRGAYADAEIAYSAALENLQSRSLWRVTLLNNRAQARLKNGDASAALKDTNEVLYLIVVGLDSSASPSMMYRPSLEVPLPCPEYDGINLRESYAKALLRRAQGEEMLEHWETAHSVWSLLDRYEKQEGSGRGAVSNVRMAQDGKARCSKMLSGASSIETQRSSKGPLQARPDPSRAAKAAAASAGAKAEEAAKQRIRAENAAAAAEESARDALRDSVDARVLSWKTGKEKNVRALLASLQDIVWPGLGWKRVGMHELVTDNQVKKVYMRAIGKLHPDKVRWTRLHGGYAETRVADAVDIISC